MEHICKSIVEDFNKLSTNEEKWIFCGRWSMWVIRRLVLNPNGYKKIIRTIDTIMSSIKD